MLSDNIIARWSVLFKCELNIHHTVPKSDLVS